MRAQCVAGLAKRRNAASPGYAERWPPRIVQQQLHDVVADRLCATGKRELPVHHIAEDFRSIEVRLTLRFFNRNYVGTHFGGSLYAMVDPHLMLLLMQLLGSGYTVWDKSARIEFVKPGRGTVRARIVISDEVLAAIRRDTAGGGKVLPEFVVEILDASGDVVATVKKTLYVRKKAGSGPDR